MKKTYNYKRLIVIILTLSLFILSACYQKKEIQGSSNNSNDAIDVSNNKYGLSINEVSTDKFVSEADIATVVANIVMPATVEIRCTINFNYTYTSFGFGGISRRTVSSSQSCQATGFFINEDGYLLTNAHVVTLESESSYPDLEYTGREILINYADDDNLYTCEIVSYDTLLDLAILKLTNDVKINNLKYVKFFNMTNPSDPLYKTNNSVKLYYGEYCVAVGNAQGYGISVTSGVVSAPYRVFNSNNNKTHAIQTDAAINEGNSGGPLCNKYACVIGINSFKIVTSTSESLGFAIPTYVVLDYVNSVNESLKLNIKYYTTNDRAY